MSSIDPEVQKYYDVYFELFATEGWKLFKQDIQESLEQDQRSAVARCDTSEKWFTERGSQGKSLRILNLENSMRVAHDNALSEAAIDDTESSED